MESKAGRSVHFTSQSNEWETPKDLFDKLDAEFRFSLDAAATPENAKCDRYFTFIQNGLAQSWGGERVWLNPPYGVDLHKWVQKAATEPSEVTVMLIPARTDTRYWHAYILGNEKAEIRFLKGRLKFGNARHGAPFPTAIVVFRNAEGDEA